MTLKMLRIVDLDDAAAAFAAYFNFTEKRSSHNFF
jgi:hypothetical protein